MKYLFAYDYKFGGGSPLKLVIAEEDGKICGVQFYSSALPDGFVNCETPLIKEASKQLGEYFNKRLKEFDLPLVLYGTDFQKKVWEALRTIPYGETCSYKELAAMTGSPKASRAVGNANNRNPIPVIIPCHRVIGHDGSLTGYAAGLEIKRKLLEIESVNL